MGLAARIRGFMGYAEEEYDEEEQDELGGQAAAEPDLVSDGAAHEVVMVKPERFDEGSEIARHIMEGRIVVINMEVTNRDVARRLLDFIGGATYAKDGMLARVAGNVYLVTPYNVEYMDECVPDLTESLF